MRRILVAGTLLACLLALAVPEAAFAHPLGNFTVNRYARLELQPRQLRVYYVLDMAEIPTYQDVVRIHSGEGLPTAVEQRVYLGTTVSRLGSGISADVDGTPLRFSVEEGSAKLSYPPGQGNLPTTRVVAWFFAPIPTAPSGASSRLTFRDANFEDRIGWKEVVVRPLAGARIDGATVSSVDQSDELRSYPQDMLSSPLDVRGASVTYTAVSGLGADSPLMVQARGRTGGWLQSATDAFTNLVSQPSLSLRFVLFALGTPRHALILGLTVTITHTAGVFALGIITLLASRFILPERLYPWLGVASGAMVAALGAWLFVARLRTARRQCDRRCAETTWPAGTGEGRAYARDKYGRGWPARRVAAGEGVPLDASAASSGIAMPDAVRAYLPAFIPAGGKRTPSSRDGASRRGPAAASIAPPELLSGRADVAPHHAHAHAGDHEYLQASGIAHLHGHGEHIREMHAPLDAPGSVAGRAGFEGCHTHVCEPPDHGHYGGVHAHNHPIGHDHALGHDHGTGWHTHAVPAPGPVGLRGLIALGISGGLLPCPSALVVLLAAVSLQRVGFGIVLVLAFSIGLAGVLTGIGLLLVYARGIVARYRLELGVGRLLPAASAFMVLALGVAITLQALVQAGLVLPSGA